VGSVTKRVVKQAVIITEIRYSNLKGKAILLQAWTDPEGSGRLRSYAPTAFTPRELFLVFISFRG
jgi:hypothetical protein